MSPRPLALSRLTLEEAAEHVRFSMATFKAWLHAGLLPAAPDSAGWTKQILNDAIQRLTMDGFQSTKPNRKNSDFVKIPHCQRCWRTRSGGDGSWHFYFRPTGEPLPYSWGSPEFMVAVIGCERRLVEPERKCNVTGELESPSTSSIERQSKTRYKFAPRVAKVPSDSIVPEAARVETSSRILLTPEEVSARYRGRITPDTLRNWRSLRIGPHFLKLGKAVLYPSDLLDAWDRKNLVICGVSNAPSGSEREEP